MLANEGPTHKVLLRHRLPFPGLDGGPKSLKVVRELPFNPIAYEPTLWVERSSEGRPSSEGHRPAGSGARDAKTG